MDYSLITHALPTAITANGKGYAIDTRTLRALQAYAVSEEEDVPDDIKIARFLELLLTPSALTELRKDSQEQIRDAYAELLSYLRGWPEDRKTASSRKEPIFSYTEDHALIVAAFRQAYGITLRELKDMHWWEFLALLRGLPEGTALSSAMSIRAMDIDPKEPPKAKAAKRKAKEAVALKRKGGRAKTGEEIISDAFSSI